MTAPAAPLLSATEPPEARGLRRDEVRLMVTSAAGGTDGRVRHARFRDLASFLEPGDLVVVNTSATTAAAVDGERGGGRGGGRPVVVHFSTELDDGSWVVELRRADQSSGPVRDGSVGERVGLPAGAVLTLVAPYRHRGPGGPRLWRARLWRARLAVECGVRAYLARVGRPISYGYLAGRWPLDSYQTVFAVGRSDGRGSAEMPSAGRPFSHELVTALVVRGVAVAPVVLDTGVSSLDSHEPPSPERYVVPAATARLVNMTAAAGGRVVAVGTTVTRALESAVVSPGSGRTGGRVAARSGWTDLVLGPQRPAEVVTGLVTGWHEPEASHLLLLEAVAGAELVQIAYDAAAAGYRWHEFGDSCLLLPKRMAGSTR